jgi:hypothetical protein
VTYSMLLDRFGEFKKKFKEQENEYVPE